MYSWILFWVARWAGTTGSASGQSTNSSVGIVVLADWLWSKEVLVGQFGLV
jgi:hypothetical protein